MPEPKDVVKQIKRAYRKRFPPEEKIRVVLEGLRGDVPLAEICRREGIAASVYYKWSKSFLEAGKNGLTRETLRDATAGDVKSLKSENQDLKRAVGELTLEVMKYKKSLGM